jgi:hypothetical protein
LPVEDRINLRYAGAPRIETAIGGFVDYIKRETLARTIERSADELRHAWRGEVDGLELTLSLQRAEA